MLASSIVALPRTATAKVIDVGTAVVRMTVTLSVTGAKGHGDDSGIDYRTADGGNAWRWIEQFIPHSGWFLVATSARAQEVVVRAP